MNSTVKKYHLFNKISVRNLSFWHPNINEISRNYSLNKSYFYVLSSLAPSIPARNRLMLMWTTFTSFKIYSIIILDGVVVKSGSDFRNFTSIDVYIASTGAIDVRLSRHDVTSSIQGDPAMQVVVNNYMNLLENSLDTCIGTIQVGKSKMSDNMFLCDPLRKLFYLNYCFKLYIVYDY